MSENCDGEIERCSKCKATIGWEIDNNSLRHDLEYKRKLIEKLHTEIESMKNSGEYICTLCSSNVLFENRTEAQLEKAEKALKETLEKYLNEPDKSSCPGQWLVSSIVKYYEEKEK